jgi:hypothetical protein
MVLEGGQPPQGPPPEPPVSWGPPPVSWGPPPAPVAMTGVGEYGGGRPPFTVGSLLADTFARYGADPIRLFLLTAVPGVLSYGVSFLTNPLANPQAAFRFGGYGVLLGLLIAVVGIVAGATTLALLEGGPGLPFSRALRRGIQRAGWMVLTAIVLGLVFLLVFLVAGLIFLVGSVAARNFALTFVLFFALVLVLIWLGLRVSLALTANVVDNLNTIDALRVSWRVTRPAGVWLRILACGLLLGLLVVPASFGALALELPAMFGQLSLLVIPATLLLSALTPLTSTLTYSAYRRLVPPFWPPWVGLPAPAPGDSSGARTIPPPAFAPPRVGAAAKGILALILLLDVVGIVLLAYGLGQVFSGGFHLPITPGSPFPGYPGFTFPPFPSFPPLQ